MSQADDSQSAPIELRVRSDEAQLGATIDDDGPLVAAAYELVADVVIVAVTEALGDVSAPSREVSHSTVRSILISRIRLRQHAWGSWEALFALPPDTVVWAVQELGLALAADTIVRVSERALTRLRNGDIDRDLLESELVERDSTLDLYFPNGKPLLKVRRRSRRTVVRTVQKAQTRSMRRGTARPTGRKGRKPKRK
jgi:hypothetical protein